MNRVVIMRLFLGFMFSFCPALVTNSYAVDVPVTITKDQVPVNKQTQSNNYLTAKEAYQTISEHSQEVLFVDVRTRAEVEFVGSPALVDALVPYMENNLSAWNNNTQRYQKTINEQFAHQLAVELRKSGLNKQSPVIFICRSGGRSAQAASLATQLGYTNAYSVVDGFEGDTAKKGLAKGQRVINGWKNSQLPWAY